MNYSFCKKTMELVQGYITEQIMGDDEIEESNVVDFQDDILELQIGS